MSDRGAPWEDHAAPAAGPWNDYAAPNEGPWNDYASPVEPAAQTPAEPGFLPTVKRTGGQMLTGLARTIDDITGPNRVTGALRETGQGIIERNPAGITSLSDVVESPWLTVKESVGQMVPQIPAGIAGRIAGAKLGAKIGGQAAGGRGALVGGIVGGLAPIFVQEYGGIRDEQIESGQESIPMALGGAVAATALERLGPDGRIIFHGITNPVARTAKQIAARAGRDVLVEGATEGAQSIIEQVSAFKDPMTAQNLGETGLSAVMGGIGGGVLGGAHAGIESALAHKPEPASVTAPEAPADDLIRNMQTPDTGPLTRAVNAGLEAEAQAAEAGVNADAPIASAMLGITPAADGEKPNEAHAPIDDKTAARINQAGAGAEPVADAGVNAGVNAGPNAGVNAGVPHSFAAEPSYAPATNAGVNAGPNAGGNAGPALAEPAMLPRPGVAIPGARDPELALDRLREQSARDLKDQRQWDTNADPTPVQAGDILDGDRPFQYKINALRARAKQDNAAELVTVPVTGGYALRVMSQEAPEAIDAQARPVVPIPAQSEERAPMGASEAVASAGVGGIPPSTPEIIPHAATPEAPADVQATVQPLPAGARNAAPLGTADSAVAQAPAEAVAEATASPSAIDQAAHSAATSPLNDLREPSDAEKEQGNYAKGHVRLDGMQVSIENPKGSIRSSKADAPEPWQVTMPAHYGYIRGTVGADTTDSKKPEQVDLTIGDAGENHRYWVINQQHPDGSGFDEHKVFTGVDSADEAVALYKASFAGDFGDKVFHSVSGEMTPDELKTALPGMRKPVPVMGGVQAAEPGAAPATLPQAPSHTTGEVGGLTLPQAPSHAMGEVGGLTAPEDHGAWWTRATAAERGAALLDAGWTGVNGKLSPNAQAVAAKPWADLRENQRMRIGAARDKRGAAQAATATPEPIHTDKAGAVLKVGDNVRSIVRGTHGTIGKFGTNAEGSPLAFDTDGRVIDRPHRLMKYETATKPAPAVAPVAAETPVSDAKAPDAPPVNAVLTARIAKIQSNLEELQAKQEQAKANGNAWSYDKKIEATRAELEDYQGALARQEAKVDPTADGWVQGNDSPNPNWKTWTKTLPDGRTVSVVQSGPRSFNPSNATAGGARASSGAFSTLEEAKAAARPNAEPAGVDKAGTSIIGQNTNGEDIHQDARGVRSIVRDGVRTHETVGLVPTREGMRVSPNFEHKGEYLTADEAKAAAPTTDSTEEKPGSKVNKVAEAKAAQPKRVNKVQAAYEAKQTARADYFTPGNVVLAYGGHDQVVAYTPPTEGRPWSVKVRRVVKQGEAWVPDPNDNRERTHATEPDARALATGPVLRVQPVTEAQAGIEPGTEEGFGDATETWAEVLESLPDDHLGAIYKKLGLGGATDSAEQLRALVAAGEAKVWPVYEQMSDDGQLPYQDGDRFEAAENWDYDMSHWPQPKRPVNLAQGKPDGSKGGPFISLDDAKARLAQWKAAAKEAGRTQDNSNKVVISLFDASGIISQPWEDAGYHVLRYDLERGHDLFRYPPIADIQKLQEKGFEIVGLLAQPPCTTFTNSSTAWRKGRHDVHDRQWVERMFGPHASTYFSRPVEYTKALVSLVDLVRDLAGPKWYAMENPVGRIASLMGLPEPTLRFDPHNFGDPYTKRTYLWGDFDPNLPLANVVPTDGSKIHKMSSRSEKQGLRSLTPEGFAYAFFMANAQVNAVAEAKTAKDIAPQPAQNTEQEVGDAKRTLQGEGPQALGQVAAAEGQTVEGERGARRGASNGGEPGASPGGRADGAGVSAPRGRGSRPVRVRAAAPGTSGESGAVGAPRAGRKGKGLPQNDAVAPEPDLFSAPEATQTVNPAAVPAVNFRITPELRLGEGGEAEKFRDNLAAIRVLKLLESDNRRATADEQRVLARYVGWGGIPNAFPNPLTKQFKPEWKARGEELRDLLTPPEHRRASNSTTDAHYTSEVVTSAMWDAVRRLGFRGGLSLEMSLGTGNFIGLMPQEVAGRARFIGVELDSITARIARALYPGATVLESGMQHVPLASGAFDLDIGNPPFGSTSLTWQHKPELRGLSIHNQFFVAGLDALKPGGIQAKVVSRYLLDAQDDTTRVMLAKMGKLLGAIRLPETAFKANALTQVVTDIVFIQRFTPGEQAHMAAVFEAANGKPQKDRQAENERRALAQEVPAWIKTVDVRDPLGGEPMRVNHYFRANPHMIVGTMDRSGSMQHGADITVKLASGADFKAELAQRIERLPADVMNQSDAAVEAAIERYRSMADALEIAIAGHEPGAVAVDPDGKLMQVFERETPEGGYELGKREITAASPWSPQLAVDGNGQWYRETVKLGEDGKPLKQLKKDGTPGKLNVHEREVFGAAENVPAALRIGQEKFERLRDIAGLRDLLKRQLVIEAQDDSAGPMEANRKELAAAYGAYVAKHGYVSEALTSALVNDMPDGALVQALELSYKPAISAAKAAKTGDKARVAQVKRAPILSQRVVVPYVSPDKANSVADAIHISLSERGLLDIERIAALRGLSSDEAIQELTAGERPLAFHDPETSRLEPRDAYLTGQVVRKLQAAKDAGLSANVRALEAVQPEPVTSDNVTALLGSVFVPNEVYADFVAHLTGERATVTFSPLTNTRGVTGKNTAKSKEWAARGEDGQVTVEATVLVQDAMNSRTTKVMYHDSDGVAHLHKADTELAAVKRKEIEREWAEWVFADGDRRRLVVAKFNERFNTRVVRQHDGSHLVLPGKVPDAVIAMRRHQLNAVWRGISERFMLLDHVVGAGKTFTAIARVMERRRMGLSKKPMIVVPNHMVEQFAVDVYRLYPGAKVLAAGKKDFDKRARRRLFGKIATGDWDVVIVPHSSFGFIGLSPETEDRFLQEEMRQALQALQDAQADQPPGTHFKSLGVKKAEALVKKIESRIDAIKGADNKDRLLTFEQMGVDDLTVDEAHEFKNLFYSSQMTDVRGMGDSSGSQKAFDLYTKVRYLRTTPTGSVVFMTGTPISNSAVEMYTMMRYLAADELRELGLEHFDAWRAQYVDASTAYEQQMTGGVKEVGRLGRTWGNARSLMDLYYSFTDAVTLDDIKAAFAEDNPGKSFPVPRIKGGERQQVLVTPSPALVATLSVIFEDYENLPNIQDVKERGAERLRLMDRARKASLDLRALDPTSTSKEENGKLDRVSDEVARIYKQWTPDRGTQLVFLDRSVPRSKADATELKAYDKALAARDKALVEHNEDAFREANEALEKFDLNAMQELRTAQAGGWNAYQQIKDNLVARGIKANEIRFIQEANNDEQKQAMFDAVNAGEIRVLIGSTPRMGAGTNVQERLVGLHHVDVTWKPSDIEQREGRIVRQGNALLEKYGDAFEVEILAYATERTADASMWALNGTKLKTINGIRKYDGAFTMEFEDEDSLSMAHMAALASGDPLLLERIQLVGEVDRLERQETSHRRKLVGLRDTIESAESQMKRLPNDIAANLERAEVLRAGERRVADAAAERRVEIEGKAYATSFSAFQAANAAVAEAKLGNPDAKWTITVDGKRITSLAAMDTAISGALGDETPFEVTVFGKTEITRSGAVRGVTDRARELASHLEPGQSEGFDIGTAMGFKLVGDVSRSSWSKGYSIAFSLLDSDGKTLVSAAASGESVKHDYSTQYVRAALDRLFTGQLAESFATSARYHRDSLARHERELPGLREQLASAGPFKYAAELAAKRERLAEVTASLAGAGRDLKHIDDFGSLFTADPASVGQDDFGQAYNVRQREAVLVTHDSDDGKAAMFNRAETGGVPKLRGFERFDVPQPNLLLAQRQVNSLFGHNLGWRVQQDAGLGPRTPAAFDRTTGRVLVNPKYLLTLTQGQWVAILTEEFMHGVDSLSETRALSVASARLNVGGDIRTEIEANRSRVGEFDTFLSYPLDIGLSQKDEQVELFARLAVLYFNDPAQFQRTFPLAYEVYHGAFGYERDAAQGSDYILRERAWRESRVAAEDGVQPGLREATGSRLAQRVDGKPPDPRLGQLRAQLAQAFGAGPQGGFYGQRLARTAAPEANESDAFYSRTEPTRRAFIVGTAAALADPARAGTTLGRAQPVAAAVLAGKVSPAVEKLLRGDGHPTNIQGAQALTSALNEIATNGPVEVRALATQITKLLPARGLLLSVDDTREVNAHGVVRLRPVPHLTLFTAGGRTGLTYGTLLHESLHAAVAARYATLSTGLIRGNDAVLKLAAPQSAGAMAQFEAVWREFKTMAAADRGADRTLSVREAINDPDEFFVRALTDPGFQQYLAGKAYEGKTLWERFKDWVKTSLFGFKREGTAASWLDAALAASGDLTSAMLRDNADWARLSATNRNLADRSSEKQSASDTLYSRLDDLRDTVRDVATVRGITERVNDLFLTQKAFNGWWHKTVGTQYHKAQVNPEFKVVYDSAQDYQHDISAFANDSAGYAPKVLPQLNGFGDVLRRIRLKDTDSRALAAPLFAGTLTDQREYDAAELAGRFKLTPHQITLYQQTRAAIGRSLDTLVASDVARFLGPDIPKPIKAMISAGDLGRFKGLVTTMLQTQLEAADAALKAVRQAHKEEMAAFNARQLAESQARKPGMSLAFEQRSVDERAALTEGHAADLAAAEAERDRWAMMRTTVANKYAKVDQLKSEGYAPLMRFGRYSVYVTREDADGEVEQVYFGLYETEREANRAARGFRAEPGVTVTQGVMSQEAHKLFAGLDPETVALFADLAGIEKTEVMQDYLKLAVANRSALKRLIHRKGVAGFSEDPTRVLASFLTSNARAASGNLHLGEMDAAITDMQSRRVEGSTVDEAMKLREYVKTPGEEAQAIRGLLFVSYIGGSIASAMVNLTQPLTMTFPYLAQYGGAAKAGARLTAAIKQSLHKVGGELGQALAQAEKEGIVSPQEIHQLQAEATRSVGNAEFVRKGLFVWGSLFSLAEQFNRRSSFIAAWHTAKGEGIADAYAFATNAVEATQGVYNKGNRPNWGRGPVGATLLTFKQFTISYLEFLKRLPNKERALALAVLFLAAGAGGMPGADDLDDLIDTLAQSLDSDFNSELARTRFLTHALGAGAADFVLHGVSATLPFDIAGRMSVGNLLPGTGMLLKSKPDKSREVLEVFGAAGSMANDLVSFPGSGDWRKLAPTAIRNLDKSIEMYQTGQYKDARHRNTVAVDNTDALFKAIGFQPAKVAADSRKVRMAQQQVELARVTESEIAAKWAQGVNEKNPAMVREAVMRLMQWNRDNPQSRIGITPAQIQRRVQQMNMSREQRFLKSTPKEMRGSILQ